MAKNPTAISRRASCSGETLATRPASEPVVAVSVSDFVQCSFQIAVLRSRVNSAPGADSYVIVRDGKEIAGPLRIEGARKEWTDKAK